MPEYLAPGVYVEEVSFRPKSIEGLSTSVAGFIGPTRYGPTAGPPELLTSFADFSRIYGGLDDLTFAGGTGQQPNFMAHAVRGFFDNGGSMLYVTRVYEAENPNDPRSGHAFQAVGSPANLTLRARFPGRAGEMRIIFAIRATANLLQSPGGQTRVVGIQDGDVVYIKDTNGAASPVQRGLYDVSGQGTLFTGPFSGAPGTVGLNQLNPSQVTVHRVSVTVSVLRPGQFEEEEVWSDLALAPGTTTSLTTLFADDPGSRLRYLTIPFAVELAGAQPPTGAELGQWLFGEDVLDKLRLSLLPPTFLLAQSPKVAPPSLTDLQATYFLSDGSDGDLPTPENYGGEDFGQDKTGLKTFEDIDEISIVAAPGYSYNYDANQGNQDRGDAIVQNLIIHCQLRMRYRVAVLDSPDNAVLSDVQHFRGKFDSTHAALYYPWITIVDPLDPAGRQELEVPPSGFVAGIYARSDVTHGVFKAPANEVVLGAVGFETLINTAQQDILNPLGINCFRFFSGRGYLLWGARTISSDSDWKYISVRRYFAYLEHSIDKGTQWAVFENNNEMLWSRVEQTITDFLFNEWRNGALLGTRPAEAFFVRCDRTTMTQNNLDNGQLVCLIGVAVVKPAEFVIFRIGQWTASSRG